MAFTIKTVRRAEAEAALAILANCTTRIVLRPAV